MNRARVLTSALALLLAGACEDRPATQVLISIATDLPAPTPLSRISMKIERFVEEQQLFTPVDPQLTTEWKIGGGDYDLPGSLVTFSGDKDEPKLRVTVLAHDDAKGGSMVRRQAIFRLIREKTLYMRMGITERCLDNADCPDEKTCIEGRCRDPELHKLPEYQPAQRPELGVECNSGTVFRKTNAARDPLPVISTMCSGTDVCIEGACYPGDVFGTPLPTPQMLTVNLRVSDQTGMPVSPVSIRIEDGPVSEVRRLGTVPATWATPPPALTPMTSATGTYQVSIRTDVLTNDVELTVTAAGFAPQVVSVPVKPGVTQYQVPAVLFRLEDAMLMANEGRTVTLEGGGRTAAMQIPPAPTAQHLRYALMDGRYLPGQGIRSGAAGNLLQAVAVLYLENVGQGALTKDTSITLGTSTTPAVFGAEAMAGAYVLDLQGQWKRPPGATFENITAPRLGPAVGGFYTVANLSPRPGCVRGKVLRTDRSACAGTLVRLLGPEGVSSSDAAGADGRFCASAAQREAAILAIGNTTRTLYVPATTGSSAHCGPAASGTTDAACTDLGDIFVDDANDCDRPPALIAGRKKPGDTCASTLECAGLASCHQGFCVSESFARVTMTWTVRSDFDLHVKLPDGQVIYESKRLVDGVGSVDVEQCSNLVTECLGEKHLENVVLFGAPGTYEVWAKNYDQGTAGQATIEVLVSGKHHAGTPRTVDVPANGTPSPPVTFTLP